MSVDEEERLQMAFVWASVRCFNLAEEKGWEATPENAGRIMQALADRFGLRAPIPLETGEAERELVESAFRFTSSTGETWEVTSLRGVWSILTYDTVEEWVEAHAAGEKWIASLPFDEHGKTPWYCPRCRIVEPEGWEPDWCPQCEGSLERARKP